MLLWPLVVLLRPGEREFCHHGLERDCGDGVLVALLSCALVLQAGDHCGNGAPFATLVLELGWPSHVNPRH